ncbi:GNAT family N-acetyltransferase [Nakamurella endophytica]|uniref:GNAT family N-acetyltransferase n=1 Tax=Nakamurella endophytica TaxID=1748367 RepID=UPI001E283798|nr:GNAT family N-acetyltransferase [Nakamurella endophytica]
MRRLLAGLPEWFGIPQAVEDYVAAAGRLPTVLARDRTGVVVGALLLDRHYAESAEIHLLAVDRRLHRHGIGTALIAAAERAVRADGAVLLSVKTLGPSRPDPGYDATRRFYRARGFLPVEELHGLWEGNPCLVMVKPLLG